MFPGGVLVAADYKHLSDAIRDTRELVANREVPAIFEATFEYNGVLVRTLYFTVLANLVPIPASVTDEMQHYGYLTSLARRRKISQIQQKRTFLSRVEQSTRL